MKSEKKEIEFAFGMFLAEFSKIHPKNSLPKWFPRYTTCGWTEREDGNWVFTITAIPVSSLGPGQTWEPDEKGRYSLVTTDAATGAKRITISSVSTKDNVVKLFEARFDRVGKTISIIFDGNIDDLDRDKLLPLSLPERD